MSGYLGLEEAERAMKLGAYHQAFEIFMAMVESGEDPAFYKLCEMALHEQLDDEEKQKFTQRLFHDIQEGNGAAAYNAGVLYSRGIGFPKDITKAIEMFSKAIARRVPQGYLALAKLYLSRPEGVPIISDQMILEYINNAVKGGEIEAAYLLGRMYAKGEVVKRDDRKAFIYLFAAAKQGHEEAKKAIMVLQVMYSGEKFEPEQKAAMGLVWKMKHPDLHEHDRD